MGYTTLLEDEVFGKNTAEQMRSAQVIRKNCDELLAMIRSVLETTKLEAGITALDREPTDVAELLEELERSYKIPRDGDVALRWRYPPTLPELYTDRAKLKHILQNLFNNALKFTDRGWVELSVAHDRDTGVTRFPVADTGTGAGKLPFIFEKFRQGDSSEKRNFEGAGLGRFIVKGFTDLRAEK